MNFNIILLKKKKIFLKAAPGKLIYDPFVGTGSFLLTCAQFGAFTMGSDIDGRQIRGKSKFYISNTIIIQKFKTDNKFFSRLANRSIKSNVEQYNLHGKVLDTLVFDICHHPWRNNPWFDAIVTDRKYVISLV